MAGTSKVLIPFRRATKRPSALSHPRRPCSSAEIRSPGAKRKNSIACFEALINCAWGAKRARSALINCAWGAKRARSALGAGRSSSNDSGSSSTCTRDWANLAEGPAGLIAELALASDVADYVRFRAVCKPWRQCSPDPRGGGLDVRFLPRRWIMLGKPLAGSCHHRFLNVSTGECIRMSLPELLEEGEHRLLEVTPEGLLLLFHKPTMIARLLNPLTRQLIDLPSLTAFVKGGDCQGPSVKAVGLTQDSTVTVAFYHPSRVAFAKPGDDSWTVVNDGHIYSALAFAGRFYCATYRGVMVLTNTSDQQQPPRLTMVADLNKSFFFCPMMHTLHLVDNGGELMLVRRPMGQDKHKKYNVYRLDLEAGILIPVKRLNGRSMFMGLLRTISISVEVFPYLTVDTIYLADECDMNIEEYNIADGSRYGRIYDGSVSPRTIIQSLMNSIEDPEIVDHIV